MPQRHKLPIGKKIGTSENAWMDVKIKKNNAGVGLGKHWWKKLGSQEALY